MKNAIFILPGNCRTFIDCIDTQYTNIISRLFSQDYTIYIYLYLKLTDPGPKGQCDWNFEYKDNDRGRVVDKINELKEKYNTINIEYKLLDSNEVSDDELMAQLKDRTLYVGHYERDSVLIRGMHCHFNFEKCGNYILEKEKSIQHKFDYIVYIRPDLFFTEPCNNIETYSESLVTLANGPNSCNNDHLAIIPRIQLEKFVFDRINIYRNNTTLKFTMPEEVYWHTVSYEVKPIGQYYIKREINNN
jgi:hypothetical protein